MDRVRDLIPNFIILHPKYPNSLLELLYNLDRPGSYAWNASLV